ncbi:endonuclease SmrB [Glaciecola sp. 1036]|uniref:endonuclease SmrB n=1 Tax=Alteromonadaceae TaxID=72275 RepID=UPI003D07B8F4
MKKNSKNSEQTEFASLFGDVTPLQHDKYVPPQKDPAEKRLKLAKNKARLAVKRRASDFQFSDQYQAHFDPNKALAFIRDPKYKFKVKALRRGELVPEIRLDLHGLTRHQAKHEIAAVIEEAYEHHHECINIIHGVSGGVLKQQVPSWLVQHPRVIGFHQAPLEWGGQGALLVLIKSRQNDKAL